MEIFAKGELESELQRLGGTGNESIRELLEKGYSEVVQMIIRPKRTLYEMQKLGPKCFQVQELYLHLTQNGVMEARRTDFTVLNDRGLRVRCSHWKLFALNSKTPCITSCLIYLHSNIGSRLDALRIRDEALKRGFSVLAFDCCGSGLSDGIYVTMGWNETVDLFAVLQSLERDASVSDICFYAHSMGAFPVVTNLALRAAGAADKNMQAKLQTLPHVLLRSGQLPNMLKPIRAIVVDSGYASMKQVNEGLFQEMQQEGFLVPKSVLKIAMLAISKSVKKRTNVDVELLHPVDYVNLCYAPALFVAANNDHYVSKKQSEELASKYAGPCTILHVEGEHYNLRDTATYAQAVDFLYNAMHPTMHS